MSAKHGLLGKEELDDDTEISIVDVLVYMLNETDIDLKTEINNPKDLTSIKLWGLALKGEDCEGSSGLIETFLNTYFRYMFSNKRKSRIEIIKAVEGLLEKETIRMSISDRMTTNLKDK